MNSNFTTKIILSTVMLLATLTNLHAQAPYDRDYNNQQYANQNQPGNGQDFYYYPEQDVYYNANYNNYSYNNGRSWITVNILPPTICIDRSPRIIVYGRGRQIWQNNRSHRDYYFRQGHNRTIISANKINAQTLSRLHASGQQIQNEANQNILLRGVNVGGWLLQEGYIVSPTGGGSGAGTQGDMKRKLYSLGYNDAQVEDFYQKWRDNYITKPDVDYIASQGFNCIRIPLHYELFLSASQRAVRTNVVKNSNNTTLLNAYVDSLTRWYDNGELFANPDNLEGIKATERLLGWCTSNNIYVIIDLHATPGSQGADANIADPLLTNDLWNRTFNGRKIYQQIVVKLWQTIATREKDNNTVAMYDLINEPNSVPGGAATIFDVMNKSINAIRTLGDTHLILIEGDGFGNEFGNSIKPANFDVRTNLVYNSHRYGDQYVGPAVDYITDANPTNTNKVGNQIVFRNQNNVPTWVGETGENSPDWVSANIDRLVGENIGYAYWTYKRFSNTPTNTIRHIPGPFLTDANPNLTQILENIKFANSVENASQLQSVAPNYKGQRKTPPYGATIWIKGNNNLYMSSENNINIRTNKSAVGDNEKFTLIDAGDNKVALRSSNNTYISCENGTKAITSTRTAFSGWESFEWWEFTDGAIALRGFNKKFVSSENGADSIRCNRESASHNSWEKFTYGIVTAVSAPVISSSGTASGTVGSAFTYTITASNTPTSYSATTLPAGLSINTSTGIISGTPTTAATTTVTIGANNTSGVAGTKTLTITIATASSNNSSIRVVGYAPNWVDMVTFSSAIQYTKLTHLNIAFENPTNASGDLSYNTQNDLLVTKGHAQNLKVMMSLGGGAASEDVVTMRPRYFSLISTANRTGFITKIVNYVAAHNLDGIDIDLEGPAINSDYEGFIRDLSIALHANGKLISAALSQGYGGANVTTATYQYFDFINIMAYDATGPWDPNTPGQHSSMTYAQSNLAYFASRGMPKSGIVLGVPFYGYGFGNAYSNVSYAYKDIVAAYTGAENVDQIGSTIWYYGIPTVKAKTNYVIDQSYGGIMIWSLDNDATGVKSLLSAIHDAIVASTGSGPTVVITAPANGAGYTANANITITATATDADGISKVEFFNGTTKLGESTTGPSYTYTWNNVPAGTYTINVKATDALNNSSTASVAVGVQGAYNVDKVLHTMMLTPPTMLINTEQLKV
ncbi:MAG: cellulase family glycosylhydrolase [Sphingobacteriales bacterium]|nr:cellulase family glycosylhydrolase [Sphingobacteriales bacterium]